MAKAFQLKIDGLKEIIAGFENLQDFKEKSAPLMRKISNELKNASNRAFEKKADPETGIRWADWSPAYYESLVGALSRKNQGKKGKKSGSPDLHEILRKSDELYRNRNRIQEPGLAGIGTNTPYARIHQYGGIIKPKKAEYAVGASQVKAHRVSEHIRTVRGKTQTVRAHDRKAHTRQEHTMKAWGSRTIPARPFLGLTKEERMYALEDIGEILVNAIKKNAGKK